MLPLHPQQSPVPTTLITLPGVGVTIGHLLQVPLLWCPLHVMQVQSERAPLCELLPGEKGEMRKHCAPSNPAILPVSSPQPEALPQSNSPHPLPSEQGPFSQPSMPWTPSPQSQPSLTDEQACNVIRPLSLYTPSMEVTSNVPMPPHTPLPSMVLPLPRLSNGHSSPGPSSTIAQHQLPSSQLSSALPSPASPPLAFSANNPLLAQISSQRSEVSSSPANIPIRNPVQSKAANNSLLPLCGVSI